MSRALALGGARPAAEGAAPAGRMWIDALALALIGASFAAWTWRRWGEPHIDYGGEVYTAWRLAEGDVLYRDVAYFTGPLSPYLNALVLRLTGGGIRALELFHLGLAAVTCVLIYRVLLHAWSRLAAFLGCTAFLTLFCFAQLELYDNTNFIAPYSHEAVHATPLCFGALLALHAWRERRTAARVLLAGLCLGAVLLTKVEHSLALGAALGLGLATARANRRELALFVLAATAPAGLAVAGLALALPMREAVTGVLGAWNYVFDERITQLEFYRSVTGFDRPVANLLTALGVAASQLTALALLLAFARWLGLADKWSGALLAAAGAALFWLLPLELDDWTEMARPWPLYTGAGALLLARRALRSPDDARAQRRTVLALFAFVLLFKILLNARIQMYGFVLALPATLCVVSWLCEGLPAAAARLQVPALAARCAGLGLFAAVALGHWAVQHHYLRFPSQPIGDGHDRLLADPERARVFEGLLDELGPKLLGGERLLVLPEGAMLNYWLRAAAPDRYVNYMPPELLMFGEQRIVAAFAADPPEAVVVLHRPTHEYGFPWFGTDYGQSFVPWLLDNYAAGALVGEMPLRSESRFGAQVLWRKDLDRR